MKRYKLKLAKPFRSIRIWYKSVWYICPKEKAGYNCYHRPGECD